MTKEQAIEEVNKAFEPAFANYIITALTEGATVSDKTLSQPTSDDCVSREQAIEFVNEVIGGKNDLADAIRDGVEAVLSALPPVTPTFPKCTTNGEAIIRAFPNLKYTIQNGRVVTTIGVASSFDLEWWNAPYEMRGDSDGSIYN